jgi:predicted aspartyl protease
MSALHYLTRRRGSRMIHLSILLPRPDSISPPQPRAILAAAGRGDRAARGVAQASRLPRRGRCYVLLALLLLLPLPNRARPSALRLPFRTAHSMIIVQGRVNGSPVTFLVDTGATRTIVSASIYGKVPFRLRTIERTSQGAGIMGDSVIVPVNLELDNHTWSGQHVAIMNLDGLSQVLGVQFDGLIGEDILREFHSVRIDYHAHMIELED